MTQLCESCSQPHNENAAHCNFCSGQREIWELRWPALPVMKMREQVAAWVSQLPNPSCIEILAQGGDGIRLRLHLPKGRSGGVISSWSSMMKQQSIFVPCTDEMDLHVHQRYLLQSPLPIPSLVISESASDPLLALAGQLLNTVAEGETAAMRIWVKGKNPQIQQKLRSMASYAYGTASIVTDASPNPWSFEISLYRTGAMFGGAVSIIGLALGLIGWLNMGYSIIAIVAGVFIFLPFYKAIQSWSQWRSTPKEVMESKAADTIFDVSLSYQGATNPEHRLSILSGHNTWISIAEEWPPQYQRAFLPLTSSEIAAILTPPESGSGNGILSRSAILDVPANPPSTTLMNAPLKIGISVGTNQPVGIDPDGHGIAVGGTRSGKTSFVYDMLTQLIEQGDDAPGIFLVDPHLSLADAILQDIAELPEPARSKAVKRLRIISPDQPEVVPLNLLTLPDFGWAANTMVQMGKRIWDDYWGPRMQAALLGLFRITHVWNKNNPDSQMGLIHVIFSAFNAEWRHLAMGYLPPAERFNSIGLDALLGQFSENGRSDQGWITEVVSPVLSKVMALELSPWLFSAMHQRSFVDMEKWVKEKAWVIVRLPSGELGQESSRLIASITYNIFDAAFRKTSATKPTPYYFIIDEAQAIATGMRIENMLAEGAKFGAKMFTLTQSLSMMRRIEGFEAVVQGLLANTSTQAFFSPDPEDADLIRAILNSSQRFGDMTFDLKSLHCWLRARVGGEWQPPTLIKVKPLRKSDPNTVHQLIREVIDSHPDDYVSSDGWEKPATEAMISMIPKSKAYLLDLFLHSNMKEKMETKPSVVQEQELAIAAAREKKGPSLDTRIRLE